MSTRDFLRLAYGVAKSSPDPSTQTGAVLVRYDDIIVAEAYNTTPLRVRVSEERLARPLKYSFIEHAERAVIYKAAKYGVSTGGATMYVPWFACCDCARAIIGAGIDKVVGHEKMMNGTPEHWMESINLALGMLRESGVELEWFDGDVGGDEILFNGQRFQP